jgi:hypothetical protein
VVQGLNWPVRDEFGELRRAGLFGREVGKRVDGLRLDLAGLAVGVAALDLHRLDGEEDELARTEGADRQAADRAAAVCGPGGAVLQKNLVQAPQPLAQLLRRVGHVARYRL